MVPISETCVVGGTMAHCTLGNRSSFVLQTVPGHVCSCSVYNVASGLPNLELFAIVHVHVQLHLVVENLEAQASDAFAMRSYPVRPYKCDAKVILFHCAFSLLNCDLIVDIKALRAIAQSSKCQNIRKYHLLDFRSMP